MEISFFPSHLCVATAAIVVGNLRCNLWATSVAQLKSFRGQLNFVSSIKNGNGQRQCPAMMAPVRFGSHENNCVIGAQVGGRVGEVCAACCTCSGQLKSRKWLLMLRQLSCPVVCAPAGSFSCLVSNSFSAACACSTVIWLKLARMRLGRVCVCMGVCVSGCDRHCVWQLASPLDCVVSAWEFQLEKSPREKFSHRSRTDQLRLHLLSLPGSC